MVFPLILTMVVTGKVAHEKIKSEDYEIFLMKKVPSLISIKYILKVVCVKVDLTSYMNFFFLTLLIDN